MNAPNRDELIELLLADELTREQQQQLRALVEDDALLESEVLDQMWLEPLLRDSFRADPDAFVGRIEAALEHETHDASQFTEGLLDAWTERTGRRKRRRMFGAAAAVSLVVAIALLVLFYPHGPGPAVQAAPAIQLQHATGDVRIVGADGQARPVMSGARIVPGDTVATRGDSSATVLWGDGFRLTLTRDASLTWRHDEPSRVRLNSGLVLVARSTRDDAHPLAIATQHATVAVSDAELLLATSDRRTDVTLQRGTARLSGPDEQAVEVSHGESGVVTSRSIEIREGSATPDTWNEDFEAGLPAGWQGNFVENNLPEGSRGGVRTALAEDEDSEPCHQIWTHSEWQHGLAVVHRDSCLNFVYRFKQSDRVQVMTLLRSPAPDSPAHDVQILQPSDVPEKEQWWRIPSGQWYTVSIPLSRLSNPVNRRRPTASFVATAFNFRPQDHACGLVIDRMWIERGTSQQIEFRPLDAQVERP